MKRLIIILALVLAPASVLAEADRSVLLTPEGTLYTAESQQNENGNGSQLLLTVQQGNQTSSTVVPATAESGNHWQPELAYDSESQTLFVFWLRAQNHILATSELIFCSYQSGHWNDATAIDDVPYHFRFNLSIGVTTVVEVDRENAPLGIPGLTVHVAWWDESGNAEVARYAMLTIEKGNVTDRYIRDLPDMVNSPFQKTFAPDKNSRQIIRQTAVFESPDHDTVDIVFGNAQTNTIHRVTLKPVENTRVRIPIGVRESSYPAPRMQLGSDSNAHVTALPTAPDRLVFYAREGEMVKYLIFRNGKWASPQSVAITERVSAGDAVSAIRKMVNGD